MTVKDRLKQLVLLPALSGYEQKMCACMKQGFEQLGLEVCEDVFGNCIAKIPGSDPGSERIMVFGHMDQIGFFVKKVEADGFLRLERVGGIQEKVLPAQEMQVQTQDGRMIDGIIGVKSHHITPLEEKYMVEKYQNLYVDIGASCKEEVQELGIDVGSPVVFKPKFGELSGNMVYGTSLDNRVACTILLELAKRLQKSQIPNDIYLTGSVQEEYNLRGAMMAARTVRPQIAIALDVALESSTPDTQGISDVKTGQGPVLSIYNFHGRGTLNGTIGHPMMIRHLERTARENGIPLQKTVGVGLLTDLSYVQLEGTGVKCVDIGIPCRYTHTPVETCSLSDIEQTIDLMEAALGTITQLEKGRG